jgi:hypothetical protein
MFRGLNLSHFHLTGIENFTKYIQIPGGTRYRVVLICIADHPFPPDRFFIYGSFSDDAGNRRQR